jgi:hypothetical protein
MKRRISAIISTAFAITLFFSGCNANSNEEEGTVKVVALYPEKVTEISLSDFQLFKQDANYKINENKRSLIVLRSRMMNMKWEAYDKYLVSLTELEKRNNYLKTEMNSYTDDKKENWKIFRIGFNNNMDTLNRDFKNISE